MPATQHWNTILGLPETEFLKRFRMTKELFFKLLRRISPYIERQQKLWELHRLEEAILPEIRFAIFLRWAASGSSAQDIADVYGVGRSTVYQSSFTRLHWPSRQSLIRRIFSHGRPGRYTSRNLLRNISLRLSFPSAWELLMIHTFLSKNLHMMRPPTGTILL